MDDFYFKRTKSKGIVYITIWKRNKESKDEYKCSIGSAKACYEKFVKLGLLENNDKQIKEIQDKLLNVKTIQKNKHNDLTKNPSVLEGNK